MTTDRSPALPSRKIERTETALCRRCFVAVPTDQLETHEAWHRTKREVAS